MSALDDLIADPRFPFAGDIRVKSLDELVIPEPERSCVQPSECHVCSRPDDDYLWTDEHWRLTAALPAQIRGLVLLETRDHHDSFADMAVPTLAELGPMMARVERAVLGIGDVGRVHVSRWGEGVAHFHLWFMPRPLGQLQLRGPMLPVWLDLLPNIDSGTAESALRSIARAMAAEGGTAHLQET
jgi:diadenosine tetraphosphate (Ap4A) HIT family hydrolase